MAKIEFDASVNQVRTLVDGGIRLVLDLPEDAVPQAAMLMECKRQAIYLHLIAGAQQDDERREGQVCERKERKPSRAKAQGNRTRLP
jgi:hypothetical protein